MIFLNTMFPALPPEILKRLLAMRGQGGMPGAQGVPGMGAPPTTPPFLPPTSSKVPLGVKTDPSATVGNLPKPIQRPAPTELQGYGPVGSLIALLGNWSARKQKKENTEAANAAQELLQAIEGAKTTGDWAPAESILHENEKLFNKVYKGWLQKSEMKQKQSQQKADPDVQGFEAGVQSYMDKKKQQPAQPPAQAQPQAQRQLGGYQLPAASPEQALGQQALSGERQAVARDPSRTLQSKLTSGEMRAAELGAGPYKTQAEIEMAHARVQESALGVIKAQHEAQKAQSELELKGVEIAGAKEKGAIQVDLERGRLAKAQLDLEIARVKLGIEREKATLGRLSPATLQKLKTQSGAADDVIKYLDSIKNQNGFTADNITYLQGLLRQAGASGLATSLPKNWFSRWTSGKSDIQTLLDGVKDYRKNLTALSSEKADTSEDAGDEGDTGDAEPEEGDEVPYGGFIYKYNSKSGQYDKTDRKAPNP